MTKCPNQVKITKTVPCMRCEYCEQVRIEHDLWDTLPRMTAGNFWSAMGRLGFSVGRKKQVMREAMECARLTQSPEDMKRLNKVKEAFK